MSESLIDLTSGVYKFRPFDVVDLTDDDVSAPSSQPLDLSESSSIIHNEADVIDLTGAEDENERNLEVASRVNGTPDRIDEMMLNLPLLIPSIPAIVGVTEENLSQPITSSSHSESSDCTDLMDESGSAIKVPSMLDLAEENLLIPMTSIRHSQSPESLSYPDDSEELSKNPEAQQDTISTKKKIRKIPRTPARRTKRRIKFFEKYNRAHNLQFDENQCDEMVIEILSKVRDKIQNQRFVALEKLFARHTNNQADPADLDPELREKLNERRDRSV